jgi:ABC-type glycerol-3-phosphate transport system permease component
LAKILLNKENLFHNFRVISEQTGSVEKVAVVLKDNDYGALFAATAISIIPVLLIYLFFQKQFIAGIAASAVKG